MKAAETDSFVAIEIWASGAVVELRSDATAKDLVQPLSKPLPDFPGKEVVMITVTYAPGASNPPHEHNAHGFIYVLEGSSSLGSRAVSPSH